MFTIVQFNNQAGRDTIQVWACTEQEAKAAGCKVWATADDEETAELILAMVLA